MRSINSGIVAAAVTVVSVSVLAQEARRPSLAGRWELNREASTAPGSGDVPRPDGPPDGGPPPGGRGGMGGAVVAALVGAAASADLAPAAAGGQQGRPPRRWNGAVRSCRK